MNKIEFTIKIYTCKATGKSFPSAYLKGATIPDAVSGAKKMKEDETLADTYFHAKICPKKVNEETDKEDLCDIHDYALPMCAGVYSCEFEDGWIDTRSEQAEKHNVWLKNCKLTRLSGILTKPAK